MKIAVSGRGLITPLGNGLKKNEDALRAGRSGTVFMQEWKDKQLESNVAGVVDHNFDSPLINKKNSRFTSNNGKMALAATYEAIIEAGLTLDELAGKRVAVILGCGGSAYSLVLDGANKLSNTGKVKRVSPFIVPQAMNSSAAASISIALGVTGESYAISSACTSGAHSIMIAARLINDGTYDMVITGGSEEVSWVNALGFDAMKALSRGYNDKPEVASRPFDRDRDGFVIAEGAGIMILENYDHLLKRGGKPKAILSGIGANCNPLNMVVPDSASSTELMNMTIKDANLSIEDIGYVNAHGTATPVGDPKELDAINDIFNLNGYNVPISSTKSMTGHMIGATSAVEAIFCTQMVEHGFIAPTANLDNPIEGYESFDFVRGEGRITPDLKHVISNSFGFGGTNGSLIFSKFEI